MGNFHLRCGPMIVGPMGLFQPFRDAIKLFCKTDDFLRFFDKFYWNLSPVLSLLLYFCTLLGFPLGGGEAFNQNLYLLIICFISFRVYFLMFGGFHSGRKYSLIGRYRSVSQIISYEVVLMFMFVCYFYLLGRWNLALRMFDIVDYNSFFSVPFVIV